MKAYLVTFGVATIAISIIGRALYLSPSYDEIRAAFMLLAPALMRRS